MIKKLRVVSSLMLASLLIMPASVVEAIEDSTGAVKITMSSSEKSKSKDWYRNVYHIENKNAEKKNLYLFKEDGSNLNTIAIDDTKEYQSMLGLGISIEESTVCNLLKMSEEKRKEIIYQWLDPVNGMGNTLFRLTIGTADFTGQRFYTYYDGNGKELNGNPDWYNETGKGFSIQKDIDCGIIQVVKEVQAAAKDLGVEKDLKFFGSSWSPPGWMKETSRMSWMFPNNALGLKGGKLKDENISDLGTYFTRYIEEYQKQGIPLYAVTIQNETGFETNYPSAVVTATQEAKVAKEIKEGMRNSEVLSGVEPTKIWAWDYNFSGAEEHMAELFATEDGTENIDGLAFHHYAGNPSAMVRIDEKYEGRYSIHLTERAFWGTDGANDIIDWLRNGAESYNGWVTMLDSNISPHQWTGEPSPTLFVLDASNHEKYWCTPEVYILGQFSKYIRPGFVRVESNNGKKDTVTNVAFKNKETGELVLVVTNRSGKNQTFKVSCNDKQFVATVPAGNTATYQWHPGEKVVDKSALENLLQSSKELTSGEYTEASKIILEEAILHGECVLEDAAVTQEMVDTALQALTEILENLEEV